MRISIALVIAATLAAANPSLAAPASGSDDILSVRVNAAGLDLNTEAGAQAFLGRISQASTKVCGGAPPRPSLELAAHKRFQLCHAKAMAGAVTQANSRLVERQFAATREAKRLSLASN